MAEAQRRTSRWKLLLLYVVIAAVFGAAFFALWVIHWLLHPWAVSLPGKPGLVGYWRGDVPFGPDDTRVIVLDLNGYPADDITGSAKVCGGPHRMTYDINGSAWNRSGTLFSLTPYRDTENPGVYLQRMAGEWDLANLVTIDAVLYTSTADDNDPPERPVSFELYRIDSDEFDETC